jgi:glycosyltransferase involved in cell wall biosynthesis
MKHVLLINYYWPPCGGSGVHRWLRFSKYFKENNCHLTVYTPENAAWTTIDEELIKQIPYDVTVIRNKIFEPQKYLSKNINPVGHAGLARKNKSVLESLIIWIRGNFFIPDARVFWIRPSVRYLKKYLNKHPEITTIISTGPPQSMHLIGLKLKKQFPKIKWIADFRDPWTQIDFYQELLPGKWADTKHKRLENQVLMNADEVVTISDACAEGLKELVNRKVHVITNGYDFPEFDQTSIDLDSEFSISHLGSMPYSRNPRVLWEALSEIIQYNKEFASFLKIKLVGSIDVKIIDEIKSFGLEKHVEHIAIVPHNESIVIQRKSQLLLLIGNNSGNIKGILTGKVFEYLGAKRPILCIGQKESNLEALINETQSGYFIDYDEMKECVEKLLESFEAFKNKKLIVQAINTEKYTSSFLFKKFTELF